MQFLRQVDPSGKSVLVRLDLDLPRAVDGMFDTTRLEAGFETLINLWQRKAKNVTVVAHRGHEPEKSLDFSLEPIAELLYEGLLRQPTMGGFDSQQLRSWLVVKENLRFDAREEEGSLAYAQELAAGHDLFVNDAFATAHRKHTSIVMLPKVLPTVFGFQFEQEMKAFSRVLNEPARPFTFILGGAKLETKLPLLEKMAELVDQILVGGKLAVEAKQSQLTYGEALKQKMIVAEVTTDTLDISEAAGADFCSKIQAAQTVVWNGPMGKFEEESHRTGTKIVADAVIEATQNGAFSLIGGGDTESALTLLELEKPGNFSHISSGGGAMMHYLAYRSLPAIEAAEEAHSAVESTSTAA
ncbi:phosphoglycerate kinase [Patescibacteria group bacterium]|nr:phosphoglycerate kinase [Patescibacteria group bacterium]